MAEPYTDAEAVEARQWSNRHGPPNAWTATAGTAARMIGRLLNERERLQAMLSGKDCVSRRDGFSLTDAERQAIKEAADAYDLNNGDPDCERIADTLRGLLERTG